VTQFESDETMRPTKVKDPVTGKITYGKTSAKESYSEWLKRQDPDFQKSILGPKRFELYKSGKVEFKDFSSVRTNKIIPLKDLEVGYGVKDVQKPIQLKLSESEFEKYELGLKKKYGDKVYSKMTDEEMGKYERLEKGFYDKQKEIELLEQAKVSTVKQIKYTQCAAQKTPSGAKLPKFDNMDDYIDYAHDQKKLPNDVWLHGSHRNDLNLSDKFNHGPGQGYSSGYIFTTKEARIAEDYANTQQGFFMVAEKKGVHTLYTTDKNQISKVAHSLINKGVFEDENYTKDKLVEHVKKYLSVTDAVENSIYDHNDIVSAISDLGFDAIETPKEKIFISPWKTLKVLVRPELVK